MHIVEIEPNTVPFARILTLSYYKIGHYLLIFILNQYTHLETVTLEMQCYQQSIHINAQPMYGGVDASDTLSEEVKGRGQ
jgi:hypothetical protein